MEVPSTVQGVTNLVVIRLLAGCVYHSLYAVPPDKIRPLGSHFPEFLYSNEIVDIPLDRRDQCEIPLQLSCRMLMYYYHRRFMIG